MPEFKLTGSMATSSVKPGGAARGEITVEIPEGWHFYAPGVEKYKKLDIKATEGPLEGVKFTYPQGEMATLVDEKVPVYQGKVTVKFEGKAASAKPGAVVFRPVISWQACSANICLPPESREVEIKFTVR